MNYYVTRDGQQYGPYSLADLQRYVAQGNIQLTDLARSEALDQWIPVEQIIGNISVPQAPAPPVNYGQVPVYTQDPISANGQPATAPAFPAPPDLHWGLVLLLGVVTCSFFIIICTFVQAAYAQQLRTRSTPMLFYGIAFPAMFVSGIVSTLLPNMGAVGALMQLAGTALMIAGHFSMKNALEEHFNTVEPIGLQLSGPMTFFFNVIYFQYHLSRIRRWRNTGVLS